MNFYNIYKIIRELMILRVSFIVVSLLFSLSLSATDRDPFQKPFIWNELRDSYYDSSLWTQYVGKSWVFMTKRDKKIIDNSRNRIFMKNSMNQSFINETMNSYREEEIEIKRRKILNYLDDFRNLLSSQLYIINKLRLEDPLENFYIIEDMYRDVFSSVGINYKNYYDMYPEGDYNITAWFNDKNKEIKKLHNVKLQEIQSKIE